MADKKFHDHQNNQIVSDLQWNKIYRLSSVLLNKIDNIEIVNNIKKNKSVVIIWVSNTFKKPKDGNYLSYATQEVSLRVCEKFWKKFTVKESYDYFTSDKQFLKIYCSVNNSVNSKCFEA
jgi:hypothetical protein